MALPQPDPFTTSSEDQDIVPLREIKGPRERLTEAQVCVLAALAAGYTVCTSNSSSIPSHEQVLIGNGSRLSTATAESLRFRDLIEQAERLLEPQLPPGYPEHWRKQMILFQLTERGRNEVIRQRLQFVPEEVVLSLPYRVGLLLQEVARYQIQYHCEPEVAIRGTLLSEPVGWQVRLPTWRRVAAYNEADNLLDVAGGASGEDETTLLWVRSEARRWHLTSSVRAQPSTAGSTEPHE